MSHKRLETIIEDVDYPAGTFYGMRLDADQVAMKNAVLDPDKLIIFSDARAGTGKTTLATACADYLVRSKRYKGIVYIAAPVQEDKQGYLAGSLEEKSAPYFEAFYEALLKVGVNPDTAVASESNIIAQKRGTTYIDCVTHTFLRGINFEEKVVIIDETQNFYLDELKKVLTRIHDNCKVIVLGHTGQCDLYKNPQNSGFARYLEHFRGQEKAAICPLTINHRGWISTYSDDLVY